MCGIVGSFNLNKNHQSDVNPHVLERMLEVIAHRGPDGRKIEFMDQISFGFNRLSIIDLKNGMQPMYSNDGKILLICNGEIFNYLELREELKNYGYSFQTSSDIEVLIPLYQKYGLDFFNKINGQFALALYDSRERKLILSRDHFGICPLFFTICEHVFLFASEIKALLKYPGMSPHVDLVGLDQIMTFPGMISPRTMFNNIYSVEPGTFCIISEDQPIKTIRYWDYDFPCVEAKSSSIDYIDKLEEQLINAVKLRTRSDVPLGAYLSGGLDSTLVLSLLKRQIKPTEKLKTFSIDFKDATLSEKKFQDLANQYYSTQPHILQMDHYDITSHLNKVIFHAENPLKETFDVASLFLSEMASKEGIKVVLAGQGADELFAGYVGYLFDSFLSTRNKKISLEDRELQYRLWADENFVYERSYKQYEITKLELYSDRLKDVFDKFNCLNHPVVDRAKIANRTKLAKRSYIDLKLRLGEHLLSDHGDRMAMANSVEVRYPFLDKEVVSLAMEMPDNLKLNGLRVKHAVRECAKKYVPKEIIDREKQGFSANGSPYLLQTKNEYIQDLLSYNTIKKQGVFNPNYVEALKAKYSAPGFKVKPPFDNDLLMPVITFGIWFEMFNLRVV